MVVLEFFEKYGRLIEVTAAILVPLLIGCLPWLFDKQREASRLRSIRFELNANYQSILQIITAQRSAEEKWNFDKLERLTEMLLEGISFDVWDQWKFEINQTAYDCLKPHYVGLKAILEPERSMFSVDGDEEHDPDTVRSLMMTSYLQEYERVSQTCRYVRI